MKKILVGVDFSKNTSKVVDQVALLARGLKAKVWIVHVTSDQLKTDICPTAQLYGFPIASITPPISNIQMDRALCAEEYKREHQVLLHLSEKLRQQGIEAQAILMKGDAAELILKQAEDFDVDMIVMGSHGHGLLRKILVGSVTEAVLRDALCNVLIIPAPLE